MLRSYIVVETGLPSCFVRVRHFRFNTWPIIEHALAAPVVVLPPMRKGLCERLTIGENLNLRKRGYLKFVFVARPSLEPGEFYNNVVR